MDDFVKCLALKYAETVTFLCCTLIQISLWESVIAVGKLF